MEETNDLAKKCVDMAQILGLLMVSKEELHSSQALCGHIPFSLFPAPVPRKTFEHLSQIGVLFNLLIDRISRSPDFMTKHLKSICSVDDFFAGLYDIYSTCMSEGLAQEHSLGIHRIDYMLDRVNGKALQVEFNTIASSFAHAADVMRDVHRFSVSHADDLKEKLPPHVGGKTSVVPDNNVLKGIVDGIVEAHKVVSLDGGAVLFVVQPGERNRFDQRRIEFEVESRGIRVYRACLDSQLLRLDGRNLYLGDILVSVVYFRAGYTPVDYPSKSQWEGRLMMERSTAIKCPNIAYQLVGAKAVQEVLARPGSVEQFMDPDSSKLVRSVFAGLYQLNEETIATALKSPMDYVLKPQREGGGNNFYGEDLVNLLSTMSVDERAAYILMDRIRPSPFPAYIVRDGKASYCAETVAELGIFSVFVGSEAKRDMNETVGHLVRSKEANVEDGGVARGVAIADSPLLHP